MYLKYIFYTVFSNFIEPPAVVEMPVPKQEVDDIITVPVPEVPAPIEPPPPERSPSPADEVIESEPLKYIEGVSKPYFHVNIKGTNHGGLLASI